MFVGREEETTHRTILMSHGRISFFCPILKHAHCKWFHCLCIILIIGNKRMRNFCWLCHFPSPLPNLSPKEEIPNLISLRFGGTQASSRLMCMTPVGFIFCLPTWCLACGTNRLSLSLFLVISC